LQQQRACERLTVEVDANLRKSIARRAREEGRPVGNLMRWIVATAMAEHDKRRQVERAGA